MGLGQGTHISDKWLVPNVLFQLPQIDFSREVAVHTVMKGVRLHVSHLMFLFSPMFLISFCFSSVLCFSSPHASLQSYVSHLLMLLISLMFLVSLTRVQCPFSKA